MLMMAMTTERNVPDISEEKLLLYIRAELIRGCGPAPDPVSALPRQAA